jgi:peptidoglycan/xylan/chitin deacetylase (PgdA/CDA1 family)
MGSNWCRPRLVHFLILMLVAAWGLVGLAQQQQQPPPPQPGVKWSEDQIKKAVAPARGGRKLTPKAWPEGNKVAVCLSFDFDNESFILARGETAPVTLSAGQFGALPGLPRVLDLLDRHRIAASFYIPAVNGLLYPESLKQIVDRGRHEIGVHGWIHENLVNLNDAAEEQRLLTQSIDVLTKITGKRPVGYRAPSWAFSQFTLGLIRKAGFLYDSSMMAMDEPYELVVDGQPTGLIELPVDWLLDDAPYFGRTGALPSPELMFQVYKDEFDLAYQEGTMFMLTMHPHVIGHRSAIVHLEKFVSYMKSKPNVWFATAEQIARHIKAARTN